MCTFAFLCDLCDDSINNQIQILWCHLAGLLDTDPSLDDDNQSDTDDEYEIVEEYEEVEVSDGASESGSSTPVVEITEGTIFDSLIFCIVYNQILHCN